MKHDVDVAALSNGVLRTEDPDRITRAVELWACGDFAACLRELDECSIAEQTSESILIRARALLRLNRVTEAAEWLALTAGMHALPDAIATHAMLGGNAAARLDRPAAARELFDRAESARPHPTILGELSYCRALAEWQAGRYDCVVPVLIRALDPSHDIIYARALALVGWTLVAQGRYVDGATQFAVASAALERCRHKDDHLYATLLHARAIGAAELAAGEIQALEADVDAFAWTSSEVLEHFQTLRHLGLAHARRGQAGAGLRRFIHAAEIAPRTPWSVLAFADCSDVSRRAHEPHGANAFLAAACTAAERIDWDLVDGEARYSLLQLSLVLARAGDADRARFYLSKFGGDARLGELSALRNDLRAELYERHVGAVVAGALGDRRAAVARLAEIQSRWAKIGYHWRSLEAKQDADLLADAPAAATAPRPNATPGPPVQLTHDQKQLLRLVMEGHSRKEAAALLHFSEYTVRNYLSVLYGLFDVPGRSALIVRCMKDDRILEMLAR